MVNTKYNDLLNNSLNYLNGFYNKDDSSFFNYYLNSKHFNKNYDLEENQITFSSNQINLIYKNCENNNLDDILINFQNLLNYIDNHNILIEKWNLIIDNNDNLLKFLEIFNKYYNELFEKIPNILKFLKENNKMIQIINYIDNDLNIEKKLEEIQLYINEFKKINIEFILVFIDSGNINFINKIQKFINHNNYKIYPYLNNNNIDIILKKYLENTELINNLILDKGFWEQDNIDKYLNLLDSLITKKQNNIKVFSNAVFSNLEKNILNLYPCSKINSNYNCLLNQSFTIKLNNLSILPCPGFDYPHFEAGILNYDKFILKNNVNAYYNIVEANPLFSPGCVICEYKFFCEKGCLKKQYEINGDYLIPVLSYCDLQKAKIDFLFKRYHELNLFHYYFQNYEIFNSKNSSESRRYLEFLLMKGYKEYEQYL